MDAVVPIEGSTDIVSWQKFGNPTLNYSVLLEELVRQIHNDKTNAGLFCNPAMTNTDKKKKTTWKPRS